MNGVESRPLRYFVAVAEELNFTRAAERLAIAPPALSRAIAQLEARLGVQVLERSTRRVTLTAAGELLLAEGRSALQALDAAAARARRAGAEQPSLVVALKADLDLGLLEPALAAYAREDGALPAEVLLCGWGEQPELLRSGRADVALVPAPFDADGLDFEILAEEPQVVALAADHPLAGRPTLRLDDLAGEDRPDDLPHVGDLAALLRFVELGRIVALLPRSVDDRYARPQIAYRPVADALPARVAVAWPRTSTSVATAAFVRAATDAAATTRRARVPA